MKKIKKSCKGFTLIELFLVVVVLVILAGAIVVVGDNSVASADAENIINNLRMLKTAALEWLADYSDYVDHGHSGARLNAEPYQITYPLTYVIGAGGSNPNVASRAEHHIQNIMRSKADGRDTIMKYIRTTNNHSPISLNEATDRGSSPKQDGYAFCDSSGAWNNPGGNEGWTSGVRKWFVVYRFKDNNKHSKRVREKLAERAEELKLLRDEKNLYTSGYEFVYMEIVDLEEYFGM